MTRHDESMNKPKTMQEASLLLGAATARLGATMLGAVHAQTLAGSAWAVAQAAEIDAFRVWCRVYEVDPEPSLAAWKASTVPLMEFLSRERSRIATENLKRHE